MAADTPVAVIPAVSGTKRLSCCCLVYSMTDITVAAACRSFEKAGGVTKSELVSISECLSASQSAK